MKIAWATDVHLNFLTKYDREPFYESIRQVSPDLLVLTGDISTGSKIVNDLTELSGIVPRVAFVLGNHDYYHSSIATVRSQVRDLCAANPKLTWLSESSGIPLSETAVLIGHDGWADAGAGDLLGDFDINDFYQIQDLNTFDRNERFRRMRNLAEESVQHLSQALSEALRAHREVYLATHVPPYTDASRHEGNPSDPEALPYFCNVRLGVMLDEVMQQHPDQHLVVLCGHTHSEARVTRDNITIITGSARYRAPRLQFSLDLAPGSVSTVT